MTGKKEEKNSNAKSGLFASSFYTGREAIPLKSISHMRLKKQKKLSCSAEINSLKGRIPYNGMRNHHSLSDLL